MHYLGCTTRLRQWPSSAYVRKNWNSDSTRWPPTANVQSLPTDGAKCLEKIDLNGRQLLVICQSSACRADRVGGPVHAKDDDAYVQNDGACSVVYEWYNNSWTFLQVIPVYGAKSVTAFTRPSTEAGVGNDFYLLVAANASVGAEADAESVLLRWETTVSSAGLELFQGFARTRRIYTKAPRRWAVHKSGDLQFAAVATEEHFQATSDNPYPTMSACNATKCFADGVNDGIVKAEVDGWCINDPKQG